MENKKFNDAVLNHYKQLVHNYKVDEYHEQNEWEFTFSQKQTNEPYIRLLYSEIDSSIEIRLLSTKAVCLVNKSSQETLSDFIHLSVEELLDYIMYIDIPGNPDFHYSSKLSNKNLIIYQVARDKELQVKLIALVAEVQLALHFSGLVYLKHI